MSSDTDELRRLADEAAAVPMGALPPVAADKILRALGEALLTASALDAAREREQHIHQRFEAKEDRVSELTMRVAAVESLHSEYVGRVFGRHICFSCGTPWPCPTRRALDGQS